MPAATAQLVRDARQDPRAFDGLVRRYQDFALAFAYARTGDREVAREVAQESFLEAWVQLSSLREDAAFGGWLRRILVKRADRVTRRFRPVAAPLEDTPLASGAAGPDTLAASARARRKVDAAVAALPDHERLTVCLFYLSERSVAEVAAFLGEKPGTVKKRLHSARRRLKEDLEMIDRSLNDARPRGDELSRRVRFFIAARIGDTATVRSLLAAEPALAAARQPTIDETAGHYMASNAGARWTALHLAANNGHLDVVDALLQAGAAVDAESRVGETALLVAAQVQQHAIVRRLLEAGADPRRTSRPGKFTALHTARRRGDAALAELLLAAGADPEARDASGRRPGERPAPDPALGSALPYPTGIKAIDLLCPLPASGLASVEGGHGIGMIVLLGELMHRARGLHGGAAAFVCLAERGYSPVEFPPILREMGVQEHTTLLVGRLRDPRPPQLDETDAHLVVADHAIVRRAPALPPGRLVVAFSGWEAHLDEDLPPMPAAAATLVLSRELARAGLYPAVDPVRSRSSVPISARHAEVAAAVRAALAAGGPLAERLKAWLSQPFHVAEALNGFAGVTVPLSRMLDEAEQLLGGALAGVDPATMRYQPGLAEGAERRVPGA